MGQNSNFQDVTKLKNSKCYTTQKALNVKKIKNSKWNGNQKFMCKKK